MTCQKLVEVKWESCEGGEGDAYYFVTEENSLLGLGLGNVG